MIQDDIKRVAELALAAPKGPYGYRRHIPDSDMSWLLDNSEQTIAMLHTAVAAPEALAAYLAALSPDVSIRAAFHLEALEFAVDKLEARILELYRAINPHANDGNSNRMFELDDAVLAARVLRREVLESTGKVEV